MMAQRPSLAKGVRLRASGESAILLVPEGALTLNSTAAAALELADGTRTLDDIARALVDRFEVAPGRARQDVEELFSRLAERQLVDL